MAGAVTLNDVLTFSDNFQFETEGLTGGGLLMVIVAIGFVVLAPWLMIRDVGAVPVVCVLAVGAILFQVSFYSATKVSAEDRDEYKQEKAVWEKEYATPYFEQLPVERFEKFQSVSYSEELAFKAEDYMGYDRYKYQGKKFETPINLVTEDGEEHLFWAEVIYQPELESSYVEYIYVEQDIIFHDFESRPLYNKGFNEVKLYTNKRL